MTRRTLSRRSFLLATGASGAAVALSATSTTAWASSTPDLRVYVLVVDGCSPEEITPQLTPNLHRLRSCGTNYPQARSLPVMETIPNHVMMMSGVRPDRSGVPANSIYDREAGVVRTLDQPTDLRAPTLLDRLHDRGLVTGSVLSKEYLHGIFGDRATVRWEPDPVVPISGHAPDAATCDALMSMVDSADPVLVFANFGDTDRVGHVDLTGTTLRAARRAALASTDFQLGRFADFLVRTGRWDNSILFVLADHSMDWSKPHRVISLHHALAADELLRDNTAIAQNGGADLLTFTGPEPNCCTSPGRKPNGPERWNACGNWPPRRRECWPATAPNSCASARKPVTWWSTAERGGGSPTRRWCPTRSPATTGTR